MRYFKDHLSTLLFAFFILPTIFQARAEGGCVKDSITNGCQCIFDEDEFKKIRSGAKKFQNHYLECSKIGPTELSRFVVVGNRKELGARLKNQQSSEETKRAFETALEIGSLEIIKVFIDSNKVNMNDRWANGSTYLESQMWLQFGDRKHIIRYMLDNGADVNNRSKSGQTLIFDAARDCDLELTKMLLDKGAEINIVSASSYTPLMLAVMAADRNPSCEPIVEELIKRGADKNVKYKNSDSLDKLTQSKRALKALGAQSSQ